MDQAIAEIGTPQQVTPSPRDQDSVGTPDQPASAGEVGRRPSIIHAFIESWRLFKNSYLTGWFIAVLLSLVGVLVVARDQIFIGAALSQASTLGVAVALWWATLTVGLAAGEETGSQLTSIMAVLFAVAAALLTTRGGTSAAGRESHEAVTGWVFLLSASLSVIIVARSPHGLEEIQRLASSSLIGATSSDLWVFGALALASTAAVAVFNRPILLLATDPIMAAAVGMRVGFWTAVQAAWLGVSVGLSIRVAGMLFTFGLLVLPALVAKNVCGRVRPMFLVAPLAGVSASLLGFLLANHYDYPPGQMTVAILAVALFLIWFVRGTRSGLSRHLG